jgi:hypothetical protein
MNCYRRPGQAARFCTLLLAALLVACGEQRTPILEPDAAVLFKTKPGGSGDSQGAHIVQGALTLAPADAPALATTCPSAGFTSNAWDLVFGKSGCLLVAPLWATAQYTAYTLSDDLVVRVLIEKGKAGRITHVRLAGQDVDGPEGIWHNTDWIPVAVPVVPAKAGFTLQVHARNVEVWRTDSHLAGGNRVAMIGTVSIGEIVYPPR